MTPSARPVPGHWTSCADAAYAALLEHYWDNRHGRFRVVAPPRRVPWASWHYWWQAQALTAVVRTYERSRNPAERDRAAALVKGIVRRNGGGLGNAYYDDLAWMGLALHESVTVAGLPHAPLLEVVWHDLRDGYDEHRGALVWRRGDVFCNVPTNGPAAILAARLGELDVARRLVAWLHAACVDADGRVLDGRRGDGSPDEAQYTYNYGTVVGADLALHAATGETALLGRARYVAGAAAALADPRTGLLPDEGGGDRGLFKGILATHLADLVLRTGDPVVLDLLVRNGEAVTVHAGASGLVGTDWSRPPAGPVDLSAHLSAVLLLDGLARLEAAGTFAP